MGKIIGQIISYREKGQIQTPAILDSDTGELEHGPIDVEKELGEPILLWEIFEEEDSGYTYRVCPTCHNFILTTKMAEGAGKVMEEIVCCMKKDCDTYIHVE